MIKEPSTAGDAFVDAIAQRTAELLWPKIEEQWSEILPHPGINWLTVEEAAQKIQRDYKDIAKLVASGEIPSHRLGGPRSIRIAEFELDEWALSQPG